MTTPEQIQAMREVLVENTTGHYRISDYALLKLVEAYERAAWQPIESAPKDGTDIILGRLEDGEMINICGDYWYQDREMGGFDTYHEAFDEPPTHWRASYPPQEASNEHHG